MHNGRDKSVQMGAINRPLRTPGVRRGRFIAPIPLAMHIYLKW
jgi:hypothetical protein